MTIQDTSAYTEECLTCFLMREGVNPYSKGYYYLKLCYYAIRKDPALLDSFSKNLYPLIAREAGTGPACVERTVRYALLFTPYTNRTFIRHMVGSLEHNDYRRNDPANQ